MASPILFCLTLVIAGSGPFHPIDEWEQPDWGSIGPASIKGEYEFQIDKWPADDRLPIPSGFPQVVLVETTTSGANDYLDVAINEDGSQIDVILSADSQGDPPKHLRVVTCESSQQLTNGVVALSALDAEVIGERAKLETNPGNHRIGFWSRQEDQVQWSYDATRWGKYEVLLTYSNASPAGSTIEIKVGDETIKTELQTTGSWYQYRTDRVGELYLPKSGSYDVNLACTELVGGAVMNAKSVILNPTCEGENPVQNDDGIITLHGRDSTVHGTMLRYEPIERKRTLGYWVKAEDAASWTFTVHEPGEFEVEVLQGCGTGNGGSKMQITVSGQVVEFLVEDTGHFQNFKMRKVGRVRIEESGVYELRIQPETIANKAACDIRQIRLLPH